MLGTFYHLKEENLTFDFKKQKLKSNLILRQPTFHLEALRHVLLLELQLYSRHNQLLWIKEFYVWQCKYSPLAFRLYGFQFLFSLFEESYYLSLFLLNQQLKLLHQTPPIILMICLHLCLDLFLFLLIFPPLYSFPKIFWRSRKCLWKTRQFHW